MSMLSPEGLDLVGDFRVISGDDEPATVRLVTDKKGIMPVVETLAVDQAIEKVGDLLQQCQIVIENKRKQFDPSQGVIARNRQTALKSTLGKLKNLSTPQP